MGIVKNISAHMLNGSVVDVISSTERAELIAASWTRGDSAAGFTRASTSTVTVTDNADNQALFQAGLPIKYRTTYGSGTYLYGIIKSYVTGTVTILGIELPVTVGELRIGPAYKVLQVTLQVSDALTVADDKIKAVMKTAFHWANLQGYIVAIRGQVETAASGADLHIAVGVGAAATDLLNSPIYLNLAQATSIVDSGVNINSTNYIVDLFDKIFVNVDQVGSGTAGSDLTLMLIIVLP